MQIAAPIPRPVRRFLSLGNFGPSPKLSLAFLAVIILAVAGFYAYQRLTAQAAPAPGGQIIPVQRGNVAATVSATGSVVATKQAKLTFNASGRIKEILVNIGDQVTAGQPLARLVSDAAQLKLDTLGQATPQDVQSARLARTSAEAALASARAKLDQLQSGPTQADLENARSGVVGAQSTLASKSGQARPSDIALQQEAVRQAELAVQQAQIDLDSNTLYAPFEGTVASIAGNPGEPAASGGGSSSGTGGTSTTGGFMTLVDPREVRVDVTVDETDVARVAVGKPVTITFDALPNRPFRGKVLSIAPTGTLTQGVVTYPVSISIDARNQVLPAGMTASTTITVDEKDDVLLVPNRAVRRQGREQVVEVMGEDGKAVTRAVRTGVQNEQVTEITDGVQEGEQIVIAATSTRAPNVSGPGGGGPGPGQRVVIGR